MIRRIRGYSGASNTDLNSDNKVKKQTDPNLNDLNNDKNKGKSFKEKIKLNLNRKKSNAEDQTDDLPNTDRPLTQNDYDDNDEKRILSISAPTSPKYSSDLSPTREKRSSSYIKALEVAKEKAKEAQLEREKEFRRQKQLEDGYYSETGEYYSAHYESNDDDNNYSNSYSNTHNIHNTTNNTTDHPIKHSLKIVGRSNEINATYNHKNDDSENDDSEMGRSPPRKVIFEDDYQPQMESPRFHSLDSSATIQRLSPRPLQAVLTSSALVRENLDEESTDPSLPEVPPPLFQINLPPSKKVIKNPLHHYATLSRTHDLKHPCSPRLSESRQELIEYQKVIELQTAVFNLRVDFWKIENSRLTAIENYRNLATKAGFLICDNCKRLLRNRERTKKYGNYHARRINPEKPHRHIRYKCTKRTYDDHILNSSASKFYPISLEKK
jgi:hypothetical protein